MRILGIDYGDVRIGLAVTDPFNSFAMPFKTLRITSFEEGVSGILDVISEENITKCVVGLPKRTDGKPSERAKLSEDLALRLRERCEVILVDERFTTVYALKSLEGLSSKKKRNHVDATAAMYILQSYLDRNTT